MIKLSINNLEKINNWNKTLSEFSYIVEVSNIIGNICCCIYCTISMKWLFGV